MQPIEHEKALGAVAAANEGMGARTTKNQPGNDTAPDGISQADLASGSRRALKAETAAALEST